MQVKNIFVFFTHNFISVLTPHPPLYMNIKDSGFSNRLLVVREVGVKGKALCMAFHMLIS